MNSPLLIALLTCALGQGEAQWYKDLADFTKSPEEHIIISLDRPFEVRAVRGTISRFEGDRQPLANVLFEIQGPGPIKKIRHALTDGHGQFRIGRVSPGIYKFKTTLRGFQSVVGTIVLNQKADKSNEIKIALHVGV